MPSPLDVSERRALLRVLRRMRDDAGLTQAELAARLGKPQPFVSRYETGERRLDIVELRRICHACGWSLGEFVARFEHELSSDL